MASSREREREVDRERGRERGRETESEGERERNKMDQRRKPSSRHIKTARNIWTWTGHVAIRTDE